jgi:uncharacterized protein (DUF2062 family)
MRFRHRYRLRAPIAACMKGPTSMSSNRPESAGASLDLVGLRRLLQVLFPIQSSSSRIAMGVSIGVVIAFTPTIGFQMGLALVVASMFNASRLASVVCVWITNPLTMGPVYALAYAVGCPFWRGSSDVGLSQLSQTIGGGANPFSIGDVFSAFHSIYSLGTELYVPMFLGGLIMGAIAGSLCYFPSKSIVSYGRKSLRQRSRNSRRGLSTQVRQDVGRVEADHSDANKASSHRRAA